MPIVSDQCPFFNDICHSPSKKKGKWACGSKHNHPDRMQMCVMYVRLWNIGEQERSK